MSASALDFFLLGSPPSPYVPASDVQFFVGLDGLNIGLVFPASLMMACAILLAGPLRATPVFERDILPLFTKSCLGCHGGLKQKGGLDLRPSPFQLNRGRGARVRCGSNALAGGADGRLCFLLGGKGGVDLCREGGP